MEKSSLCATIHNTVRKGETYLIVLILTVMKPLYPALWIMWDTVIVVTLNIILGMTLAEALSTKLLSKLSAVLKIIFILPMMIAPIVTATIWKLMFSPIYGVLNGILVSLGFDRINWFADVIPARTAIIVVEVWATTPLCMLILMAALKTVPEELLEAAKIDGASSVKQFLFITLPQIRKFVWLVVMLRFMDAIRMFDIVYNLTNGGPGTATETLASTIYKSPSDITMWAKVRRARIFSSSLSFCSREHL